MECFSKDFLYPQFFYTDPGPSLERIWIQLFIKERIRVQLFYFRAHLEPTFYFRADLDPALYFGAGLGPWNLQTKI